MTDITFRPYETGDKEACLALLRANTPAAFDPSEEADFSAFLDAPNGPYFVLLCNGHVVGCGGYNINPARRAAGLCWGMVDPACHGQKLGQRLLQERLTAIARAGTADEVLIDTSQVSEGFFARFGFSVTGRTPDGIGPGLDEIAMRLILSPKI